MITTSAPPLPHLATPPVTCNDEWVSANTDRVNNHRARLRSKGLRPVQLWLPDARSEQFLASAKQQSQLVAQADSHDDTQSFFEALGDRVWDQA